MGEALTLLTDCINREVQKGSMEVKGDWKPVIFYSQMVYQQMIYKKELTL